LAIESGTPEMGIFSYVIIGVMVLCIFFLFGFYDYVKKFSLDDETPEQRKGTEEEIVRILSGTSTPLSDRRKEDKKVNVVKILNKTTEATTNCDDPGDAPNGRR